MRTAAFKKFNPKKAKDASEQEGLEKALTQQEAMEEEPLADDAVVED